MIDADELRARLASLRAVRASGAARVRDGEDEVTYRTDAELASAIADVERQIAAAEGFTASPVAFVNFRTKRGW